MFEGFELRHVKVNGVEIAFRIGGKGAPLLMLHGFPQTHAMWAQIAPKLASSFTVVCSDLRGYGASGKPLGVENYSFKEMGIDQLELMSKLGFEKFRLIGHDRGARTAHRMALEAGERLQSLVLMDIVPTHLLLDQLSKEVARAYYHWLFLAQPLRFQKPLSRRIQIITTKVAFWDGAQGGYRILRPINWRHIEPHGVTLIPFVPCVMITAPQ